LIDYDIPGDFDSSNLNLTAEVAGDQQIGVDRDYISVNDPDSGGGSTVQLSASLDTYEYLPGDEVVVEVEATDDGEPIVDRSIDVFLRYGYNGPPLYSTTVTTDGDGLATTSTTISADTPDGLDLDGSAGMEYNSSTYTDSLFGDIEKYDYGFNYPDNTPGEPTTYSIEVTNNVTGDPIEGVPFQFDAIYDSGRAGSFGTGKLVSGSDGTDQMSVDIPSDLGFESLANHITRYEDNSIAAVTYPNYPGTLSTEDTLAPGQTTEFSFSVPDDVSLSGIAFGREGKSFGTQFQGPGTFSLTVPSNVDSGDSLSLTIWAIDDQGAKYRDRGYFEVSGESISVDASGETGVSVGGTATVSISASQVDQLMIDQLWTDWDLSSSNPDGGTVTEQISDAGTVTIDYDSEQSSVSPSITVSLENQYVGGTYGLVVTASNSNSETAETTALITIG
jgi:hypothetical protein